MPRPTLPLLDETRWDLSLNAVLTDAQDTLDDHETRLDATEATVNEWQDSAVDLAGGLIVADADPGYPNAYITVGSSSVYVDSYGVYLSGLKWQQFAPPATASVLTSTHIGSVQRLYTAATITLPDAADNAGGNIRFFFSATPAGNVTISTTGGNTYLGVVPTIDVADSNAITHDVVSGSKTVLTFNGTTQGGRAGSWVELTAISSTIWHVAGVNIASGSPSSIFS